MQRESSQGAQRKGSIFITSPRIAEFGQHTSFEAK